MTDTSAKNDEEEIDMDDCVSSTVDASALLEPFIDSLSVANIPQFCEAASKTQNIFMSSPKKVFGASLTKFMNALSNCFPTTNNYVIFECIRLCASISSKSDSSLSLHNSIILPHLLTHLICSDIVLCQAANYALIEWSKTVGIASELQFVAFKLSFINFIEKEKLLLWLIQELIWYEEEGGKFKDLDEEQKAKNASTNSSATSNTASGSDPNTAEKIDSTEKIFESVLGPPVGYQFTQFDPSFRYSRPAVYSESDLLSTFGWFRTGKNQQMGSSSSSFSNSSSSSSSSSSSASASSHRVGFSSQSKNSIAKPKPKADSLKTTQQPTLEPIKLPPTPPPPPVLSSAEMYRKGILDCLLSVASDWQKMNSSLHKLSLVIAIEAIRMNGWIAVSRELNDFLKGFNSNDDLQESAMCIQRDLVLARAVAESDASLSAVATAATQLSSPSVPAVLCQELQEKHYSTKTHLANEQDAAKNDGGEKKENEEEKKSVKEQ
eukprot:MONOS_7617.1-p1 / transcript=MONOS_7617.1 / gene=MONOS_7617 / organism=Monocercomonoides_exilis_PA203 / gene_product=unspecified product / transcript_product=unspecified product / location=Mono_scaffold00265:21180-22658(+) / protein_length=493 / sequence_SO=supercontig / SO=protein_coding / is_pseudo=false